MSAYQLRTPAFTCLVVTDLDTATGQEMVLRESAPIVRWAHGKPLTPLRRWCETKWPGKVEWVALENAQGEGRGELFEPVRYFSHEKH